MKQRDYAEHHHADDKDDEQEAGATARVKQARTPNRCNVERPTGFERVDRFVLRTVVLEDAANVG